MPALGDARTIGGSDPSDHQFSNRLPQIHQALPAASASAQHNAQRKRAGIAALRSDRRIRNGLRNKVRP
jgi:hypothetical protein